MCPESKTENRLPFGTDYLENKFWPWWPSVVISRPLFFFFFFGTCTWKSYVHVLAVVWRQTTPDFKDSQRFPLVNSYVNDVTVEILPRAQILGAWYEASSKYRMRIGPLMQLHRTRLGFFSIKEWWDGARAATLKRKWTDVNATAAAASQHQYIL